MSIKKPKTFLSLMWKPDEEDKFVTGTMIKAMVAEITFPNGYEAKVRGTPGYFDITIFKHEEAVIWEKGVTPQRITELFATVQKIEDIGKPDHEIPIEDDIIF